MVLLVVDAQNQIVAEPLYRRDLFIRQVARLIAAAREKRTEVIYVCHEDGVDLIAGTKDFAIYDAFAPVDGEKQFTKHYNSAFRGTGLTEYLVEKQETQVMVVGLQTDYCLDATIKCGFEHGFSMFVPAGCNTTVDNEFMAGEQSYRYYNEKMWNGRYADCVAFEEALAML